MRSSQRMLCEVREIYRPDDYDRSPEDKAIFRDIDALNEAILEAGVRVFVGGLLPPNSARSLGAQASGEVLMSMVPDLGTREHVGGFWVLETVDVEEALASGRKAAIARRTPDKVHPSHRRRPEPEKLPLSDCE